MVGTIWFCLIGALLVLMALGASMLRRLPLTTSLLYLAVGVALGPKGAGLLEVDFVQDAPLIERLAEVAVLISLFSAGLKLRASWSDPLWRQPIRLATVSMCATALFVALAGVFLLDLPVGAAVLLGAVLAPTDPVLASDVQVESPVDRDRLRFSLTGEAGLNDGTAFPFVMLGLGLLGHHELGAAGWRWLAVDVAWAVAAGLVTGWVLGTLVGRFVLHLRQHHREAVGSDDFLALGLIALAYGMALLVKGYGFLAVFTAGLALRRIELDRTERSGRPPEEVIGAAREGAAEEVATSENTAPAYMTQAALGFTEHLERLAEVALVVLTGSMLLARSFAVEALWFVPLLFLVIRPISAAVALSRGLPRRERRLIGWFGIRGIGSIYYLAYAIAHGVEGAVAERLVAITLATVAASVVVHGISVTPLMERYGRKRARG